LFLPLENLDSQKYVPAVFMNNTELGNNQI